MNDALVRRLHDIVGPDAVLVGDQIGARYAQDLWGSDRIGDPRLVVRPANTDEVAAVLRVCHHLGQPVVAQGGMTGLVSGGLPSADELVLSLERMRRILEVDPLTKTATVEAGVTLQEIQDRVNQEGFIFPLDLASRASCTIGGCLSTNAGGTRVVLYGMSRDLVAGVEAVLADGSVINGLHKLRKNNAGYDLKHLFVGTEGTLGIVTRAVLRLRPQPSTQQMAFCGLRSVDDAIEFLHRLEAFLPGTLSAFETVWDSAYGLLLPLAGQLRIPITTRHPLYVLVEAQGSDRDEDPVRFRRALERCKDLLDVTVTAETAQQCAELWALRERLPAELLRRQPLFGFDISLPLAELEDYLDVVETELRAEWPAVELLVFGHLGDGNLHIAVMTGETTRARKPDVEEIVYRNVATHHGSISGEHGIGFEKRPYLHHSRTAEEIELMRRLKAAVDERQILNRDRVFLSGHDRAARNGHDPLRQSLQPFGTSEFSRVSELAARAGAINLAQDVPDFNPSDVLMRLAADAIASGHNQYSPSIGLPELRQAIATALYHRHGLVFDAETEVTVTAGATEALWSAATALMEPGDEAIVIEPFYEQYPPCVAAAGGRVSYVPTSFPDFRIDLDRLRETFSSRTKLIFLNTPTNPTGAMLNRDELHVIGQLAAAHGTIILADETYEHLVFDGARHVPVASIESCRDRTITISSASKTFAVTGWRVGWAVAPRPLSAALRRVHQFVTFSAPSPFQWAVARFMETASSSGYFDQLRSDYAERRNILLQALAALPLDVRPCQGTSFLLGRCPGDDVEWCDALVRIAGVAPIPGSIFYHNQERGRGLVRFAFCKRRAVLEEVRARLARVQMSEWWKP